MFGKHPGSISMFCMFYSGIPKFLKVGTFKGKAVYLDYSFEAESPRSDGPPGLISGEVCYDSVISCGQYHGKSTCKKISHD
jgi:hypothetical protein